MCACVHSWQYLWVLLKLLLLLEPRMQQYSVCCQRLWYIAEILFRWQRILIILICHSIKSKATCRERAQFRTCSNLQSRYSGCSSKVVTKPNVLNLGGLTSEINLSQTALLSEVTFSCPYLSHFAPSTSKNVWHNIGTRAVARAVEKTNCGVVGLKEGRQHAEQCLRTTNSPFESVHHCTHRVRDFEEVVTEEAAVKATMDSDNYMTGHLLWCTLCCSLF